MAYIVQLRIRYHSPLTGGSAGLIEDSEAIQLGEAVSCTLLQEQLHSVLGTLSERGRGGLDAVLD